MTADNQTALVIGLGSMGYGMAGVLARGGWNVLGRDTRPEVAAEFAARHPVQGERMPTVALCVVVNADQSEQALFGPNGAAAAIAPDGVIIACATMSPERARDLAQQAHARGLLYVDAPISGGAAKAAAGELTIFASGDEAAMARARPALEMLAAKLYHLGAEPGVGASFKMINQLLAGVHIAAACEAVVFARRLGLDLDKVYEVITSAAGNSWMFENRIPHVLEGDYHPRSAVEIFTKDLGIISDMSRAERFATPMASAALQLFLMTAAAGMAGEDDASVARLYARLHDIRLPEKPA